MLMQFVSNDYAVVIEILQINKFMFGLSNLSKAVKRGGVMFTRNGGILK